MLHANIKKLRALFEALRPQQWIKNLLVFAAPLAAGTPLDQMVPVITSFAVFCSASSIGYIINDWKDKEADKLNPLKASRPFAANQLTLSDAVFAEIILIAVLILLIRVYPSLVLVTIIYLGTTIIYTLKLKQFAVVEMVVISFCFVLRAIAGAQPLGVKLSEWFLLVVSFGALLIVSGKRLSEKLEEKGTRKVLNEYSSDFLRDLLSISTCGVLLGYALWSFGIDKNPVLAKLSFLPLSIFVLRLYLLTYRGSSGVNELILAGDKILKISLLVTLVSLGLVFYI